MTERAHDDGQRDDARQRDGAPRDDAAPGGVDERDAELRAIGVDPDRVVDPRDVEYLLGDAFHAVGIELDREQQEAVVCTLLGYRYPDSLAPGDLPPSLALHPIDDGDAMPIGQLHRNRPLVLFFGSYT